MKGKRFLAALGLMALLFTLGMVWLACGEEEAAPAPPPAEHEEAGFVDVVLQEWSISEEDTGATSLTVAAGEVTFEAHNEGAVPHELEVFKIGADVDIASLPVDGSKADPEAQGAEEIGEIEEEDLPGGATAFVTLNLEPGRYLLICNIPGHYQQGMYAELTVEE